MITEVSIVPVFVKDIDEAKTFYTEVLGFTPKDDITLGEGYRWCTVSPPTQPEINVHLTIPGPPLSPELVEVMNRAIDEGSMHSLGYTVDDCRATYEELSAKGVVFLQEPAERPYGVEALMRDNSGNTMVLVERREFRPEDFA